MFKVKPIHEEDIIVKYSFCSLPDTKIILNSDGYVSQCCYQARQIGSILEDGKSLLDIWNSRLAKEIRNETNKGNLHQVCTSTNICPYINGEKKLLPIRAYKNSTYPTYIEICLNDSHCNIGGVNPSEENPACIMCIRNHRKPNQRDLTDLMCEKTKPLMPFIKHLSVLGIAEPFWKDKVFDIFDKLEFSRYREQIRFETNTNGTLLTPKVNKRFFKEVGYSDISFSLDAATPETFIKIRRIDAYKTITRNLKNFIKLKKEHEEQKNQHIVSIWNNINMINVHEMTMMVEEAANFGVDHIIMLPTHNQNGNINLGDMLINENNVNLFSDGADKAMEKAKEIGVKLIYAKPFNIAPKKEPIYQIQIP